MKKLTRWIPWVVGGLATLWVVSGILPRSSTGFQVGEYGRIPVVLNGRVQPLDSVARNALRQLRNKQTALDGAGHRVPMEAPGATAAAIREFLRDLEVLSPAAAQ